MIFVLASDLIFYCTEFNKNLLLITKFGPFLIEFAVSLIRNIYNELTILNLTIRKRFVIKRFDCIQFQDEYNMGVMREDEESNVDMDSTDLDIVDQSFIMRPNDSLFIELV